MFIAVNSYNLVWKAADGSSRLRLVDQTARWRPALKRHV